MKLFPTSVTLLLSLCACIPNTSERETRLNIYSTADSERQFDIIVQHGEAGSATYHLVGTDARHDSVLLDSGFVNISILSNSAVLSQSLWVDKKYAEPTVDVYFNDADSAIQGFTKQSLSVFYYDKGRLLLE